MKLFNKKVENNADFSQSVFKEDVTIKVLGSGCKKCNELESKVKMILNELNVAIEVEHITDVQQIASLGVMRTPALMMNNKLIFSVNKESIAQALKELL